MEVNKRKETENSKVTVVIKKEMGERKTHGKKRCFKIKETR